MVCNKYISAIGLQGDSKLTSTSTSKKSIPEQMKKSTTQNHNEMKRNRNESNAFDAWAIKDGIIMAEAVLCFRIFRYLQFYSWSLFQHFEIVKKGVTVDNQISRIGCNTFFFLIAFRSYSLTLTTIAIIFFCRREKLTRSLGFYDETSFYSILYIWIRCCS